MGEGAWGENRPINEESGAASTGKEEGYKRAEGEEDRGDSRQSDRSEDSDGYRGEDSDGDRPEDSDGDRSEDADGDPDEPSDGSATDDRSNND